MPKEQRRVRLGAERRLPLAYGSGKPGPERVSTLPKATEHSQRPRDRTARSPAHPELRHGFCFQAKEPKAVMKIEHLNATFQPAKIGHPHGLQITYLKDNSTRNIFVYHEDGKVGAGLPSSRESPAPTASAEPAGPSRGMGPGGAHMEEGHGLGRVRSVLLRGRPPCLPPRTSAA